MGVVPECRRRIPVAEALLGTKQIVPTDEERGDSVTQPMEAGSRESGLVAELRGPSKLLTPWARPASIKVWRFHR